MEHYKYVSKLSKIRYPPQHIGEGTQAIENTLS
jgi:hypothetical protein